MCFVVAHVAVVLAGPGDEAALVVVSPEGQFTVGDTATVRVSARGGVDAMWGELSVQVTGDGPWAVADGPTEIPGSSPPVWEVALVALEVGELELPSFAVSLRSGDDEPTTITTSEPAVVTVVSVLDGEDDQAPAPLRDPLGVHGFPWEWVGPLFVVLAPFVIAAAWWWRRRRAAEGTGTSVRSLPPFEEFERSLEDIRSRIGREPAEVVCDRLAVGLRRYLERRSGEPAAEMTSHELRVLARREGWPRTVQTDLHGVLGVADGVRFGRRPVTDAELMNGRDCCARARPKSRGAPAPRRNRRRRLMMRLASPYWLTLAAFALVAAGLWLARRRWQRYPFPVLPGTAPGRSWYTAGVATAAAGLLAAASFVPLAVALARPQEVLSRNIERAEGVDLAVVLDISGSMAALDFRPSDRLGVAKDVIGAFLSGRPHDRIALVIFAGAAVTLCPLTLDHQVAAQLLKEVEINTLPDGTAVGMGLGTAVSRLRSSTAESKVVVLVTDGSNNAGQLDPMTAADLAVKEEIAVHTVLVGRGERSRCR